MLHNDPHIFQTDFDSVYILIYKTGSTHSMQFFEKTFESTWLYLFEIGFFSISVGIQLTNNVQK